MLDRDVQNHLGRRLRALYGRLASEDRVQTEHRTECGARLAKAQADLATALDQRPPRRSA